MYAAALLTSVPIFVRMGLYRAVIRFLGPKAILAVITGVSASVVLLAAVTLMWPQGAMPLEALPIYWSFALIYVGGSVSAPVHSRAQPRSNISDLDHRAARHPVVEQRRHL